MLKKSVLKVSYFYTTNLGVDALFKMFSTVEEEGRGSERQRVGEKGRPRQNVRENQADNLSRERHKHRVPGGQRGNQRGSPDRPKNSISASESEWHRERERETKTVQ